jgi:membrane protease YdiL (CAAX protease family)
VGRHDGLHPVAQAQLGQHRRHVRIAGAAGVPFWMLLVQLLVVHTLVGIPLSHAWRRTGSLAAPGLAHAVIDGVRNGLQA